MKVFFFTEWVKGAVGIEKSTQSFSFVKVFFFVLSRSILEKEDEKKNYKFYLIHHHLFYCVDIVDFIL